jgi:hypothetical protein
VFNVIVRGSNAKYKEYPSVVEVAANPQKYIPIYGVDISVRTDATMDENALEM